MSVYGWCRRLWRLLLAQPRRLVESAHLYRLDCEGLPWRCRDTAEQPGRQLRPTRRPHWNAAPLLRERARCRRRSGGRVRTETGAEWLFLGERLAALLRQHQLELLQRSLGVRDQRIRGGCRLTARRREFRRRDGRAKQRLDGSGDRLETERCSVLRPRADLGRRRRIQP